MDVVDTLADKLIDDAGFVDADYESNSVIKEQFHLMIYERACNNQPENFFKLVSYFDYQKDLKQTDIWCYASNVITDLNVFHTKHFNLNWLRHRNTEESFVWICLQCKRWLNQKDLKVYTTNTHEHLKEIDLQFKTEIPKESFDLGMKYNSYLYTYGVSLDLLESDKINFIPTANLSEYLLYSKHWTYEKVKALLSSRDVQLDLNWDVLQELQTVLFLINTSARYVPFYTTEKDKVYNLSCALGQLIQTNEWDLPEDKLPKHVVLFAFLHMQMLAKQPPDDPEALERFKELLKEQENS